MTGRRHRVLLVQETLPEYRVRLFDLLADVLRQQSVDLTVVAGREHAACSETRPWLTLVPVARYGRAPLRVVRLRARFEEQRADLVIVEHASRLVSSWPVYWRLRPSAPPFAYWGHGQNLQSSRSLVDRLSDRYKRAAMMKARWWFAYTDGSADRVALTGFPRGRITTLNNSLDTSLLSSDKLQGECNVGFLGSLRADKGVTQLAGIADHLALLAPRAKLLVAGTGPLESELQAAADVRSNMVVLGSVEGDAKARFLEQVRVLVVPRMVGLVAVDALASGTPIVTPRDAQHSPEVEYLEHNHNCVMTRDGASATLAHAVATLLSDERSWTRLHEGCRVWHPTLDEYVRRFSQGILAAISMLADQRDAQLGAPTGEGRRE